MPFWRYHGTDTLTAHSQSVLFPCGSNIMQTQCCTAWRVGGDCARLNRTDAEEAQPFIARILPPEEIDEGTKPKQETLQYEVI